MGTVFEFIFIHFCHYKFNEKKLDLEKSKSMQLPICFCQQMGFMYKFGNHGKKKCVSMLPV